MNEDKPLPKTLTIQWFWLFPWSTQTFTKNRRIKNVHKKTAPHFLQIIHMPPLYSGQPGAEKNTTGKE
jgi:hypothetical protein